jgi:HAE1 family hydrophobic/amphiphilic exporter-1
MSDSRLSGLPALSVRRPWLVTVLNLLIVIAGIAAILGVEVRELPNIDRPIVTVRANYPGASPETLDAEVTRVIEGAAARVTGVYSVRSSSEEGNLRVHVEFRPDVDLIDAANDVREAVSRVERELPEGVEDLTVIKADDDASPIMQLAVSSTTAPIDQLTRLVEDQIEPELTSVAGVADVTLFGERRRVMRVRIDPARLAAHRLAVTDVAQLLETARADVPAGSFESRQQEVLVRANASITTPEQLEALYLKPDVRLGDVAEAFFSPADATAFVRLDGRSVISLGILRQAQSNSVAISEGVRQAIERLNRDIKDVQISVVSDDAVFIEGAIREVLLSLAIAIVIVVAVVGIFIGQWRATLIPLVAIPVSLIGTVAAIWLLGFSINLLTLLALVIASGLVVDDAIVVLENIQRRRAEGLGARAAAVLGTREVFFAVLATTATLVSVFLPISFLPSTAGRLFVEFGYVMSISVALSSFVALSLGPSMASRLDFDARPGPWASRLGNVGRRLSGLYERILERALRLWWAVLGVCLLIAVAAGLLYTQIGQELVPDEDRGVITVSLTGPDGVGLDYTDRQVEQAEQALAPLVAQGVVQKVFSITGRYDPHRGQVVAPLQDWEERDLSQAQASSRVRPGLERIPGAQSRVSGGNSLGLRNADGSISFALTGSSHAAIAETAEAFALKVERELPRLRDVRVEYQATQPQLSMRVDRQRAADLGVPVDDVETALRSLVDGDEIVELSIQDRSVPVILESAAGAIRSPQDLLMLNVRAAEDRLVPLAQFVSVVEEGVPSELDRHGLRRAVEINASIDDGYPLQAAVDDLRQLAESELPAGTGLLFLGEAATLEETSQGLAITFGIALLVVFLVLVAQFESLTSAAVIMITVPFGLAAAVFALVLSGTSLNIYSQIGLLLLVGVMAKNGILMVEFADQLRDRGRSVAEAAHEAAVVRLRPIAMTMASTVLGALPLVIGSGAGAESRAAIGWVIFGGLALAAIFTLFLTPVVYLMVAGFSSRRAQEAERLEAELKAGAPDAGAGAGQ